MPIPLSVCVRQQIVEQKLNHISLMDIARNQQLSYCSVRNVWKRYTTHGVHKLAADYSRCGRPAARSTEPVIYRAAVWLKRLHPSWGAAFINVQLQQRYSAQLTERTLQRWFKAKGLNKAKSRLCCSQPLWAHQEHDVWQIDAKEKLHLASGAKACYLTIVDEKSGCMLKAGVFPPLAYQ